MLIPIAIPEILRFGALERSKIPPVNATATYKIFPIFPSTGIRIFANLLAFSASWNNSSLRRSKSASLSLSWQKTCTTFCPFIISSTKPSTFPSATCWRTKYFAEFPPTFFVTKNIRITPHTTTIVIHTLKYSIIENTVSTVIEEIKSCGILCDTI